MTEARVPRQGSSAHHTAETAASKEVAAGSTAASPETAVPEGAILTAGAVKGLTDSRFDTPANTPRRAATAHALQATYGNAYVQRLMSPATAVLDATEGGGLSADVAQRIEAEKSRGQPLPEDVREQMEPAFGQSFESVKVHTDASSSALAQSISARAFTTGSDIFFKQGAYDPTSSEGKHTLAHELAHVTQQGGQGTARGLSHPGDALELQAEQMASGLTSSSIRETGVQSAAQAVQGHSTPTPGGSSSLVMRGDPEDEKKPAGGRPSLAIPKVDDPDLYDLLRDCLKGADMDNPEAVVIQDLINTEKVSSLDNNSLIILDDLLERHIKFWEQVFTGLLSEAKPPVLATWVFEAGKVWRGFIHPEAVRRRNSVEQQDNFWRTIEEVRKFAKKEEHLQVLYNVAPILWKHVRGETIESPDDKLRAGYLTRTDMEVMVSPDNVFFVTNPSSPNYDKARALMSGKMGARAVYALAGAFNVSSEGQRPGTSTAKAAADALAEIEDKIVEGMRWLTINSTAFEGGAGATSAVSRLIMALEEYAKSEPRSVYGAFKVYNYLPDYSKTDSERLTDVVDEINDTPAGPGAVETGPMVEVELDGVWVEARRLARRDNESYVHYVGRDVALDEWVPSSRIRSRGSIKTDVKEGDIVSVEWTDGNKYQVEILQVGISEHEGQYRVHWLGYDDVQDTWINRSRVKAWA